MLQFRRAIITVGTDAMFCTKKKTKQKGTVWSADEQRHDNEEFCDICRRQLRMNLGDFFLGFTRKFCKYLMTW